MDLTFKRGVLDLVLGGMPLPSVAKLSVAPCAMTTGFRDTTLTSTKVDRKMTGEEPRTGFGTLLMALFLPLLSTVKGAVSSIFALSTSSFKVSDTSDPDMTVDRVSLNTPELDVSNEPISCSKLYKRNLLGQRIKSKEVEQQPNRVYTSRKKRHRTRQTVSPSATKRSKNPRFICRQLHFDKNRQKKARQAAWCDIQSDLQNDWSASNTDDEIDPCIIGRLQANVIKQTTAIENPHFSLDIDFPPFVWTKSHFKTRRYSECDSEDSFIVFAEPIAATGTVSSTVISHDEIDCHVTIKPSLVRQRQLSECSDDSFVISFEATDSDAGSASLCEFECDSDDSSTDMVEGSDDESESSSSCVSPMPGSKRSEQPDSGFEEKKVHFNLNPTVHVLRAWDYAYRSARKSEWEQIGRDRVRFLNRINNINKIIGAAMDPVHRQRIYEERFADRSW